MPQTVSHMRREAKTKEIVLLGDASGYDCVRGPIPVPDDTRLLISGALPVDVTSAGDVSQTREEEQVQEAIRLSLLNLTLADNSGESANFLSTGDGYQTLAREQAEQEQIQRAIRLSHLDFTFVDQSGESSEASHYSVSSSSSSGKKVFERVDTGFYVLRGRRSQKSIEESNNRGKAEKSEKPDKTDSSPDRPHISTPATNELEQSLQATKIVRGGHEDSTLADPLPHGPIEKEIEDAFADNIRYERQSGLLAHTNNESIAVQKSEDLRYSRLSGLARGVPIPQPRKAERPLSISIKPRSPINIDELMDRGEQSLDKGGDRKDVVSKRKVTRRKSETAKLHASKLGNKRAEEIFASGSSWDESDEDEQAHAMHTWLTDLDFAKHTIATPVIESRMPEPAAFARIDSGEGNETQKLAESLVDTEASLVPEDTNRRKAVVMHLPTPPVPPVPHPSLDDRKSVRLQTLGSRILQEAGENVDEDSESSENDAKGPVVGEYGSAYEDEEEVSQFLLEENVDSSDDEDENEDKDGVD
jgi:hypothetical protein